MEEKKEYVKLWLSYESYFEPYSDVEVGRLVRAMMWYRASREEPEFNGNERYVWPAIRRDIDESIKAQESISEKRSEAGKLGGRSKEEKANALSENPKKQMLFDESKKSHGKGQGQGQGNGQGESLTRVRARDTAFETFWNEYPKKVGKVAARKAFDKVNVPLETLVDAVKSQKCSEQWTRENGRYIPNPTTWLNQGRWDDTLSPPSTPTSAPGYGVSMDDMDRMVQAAQWAAEQGGGDG